MKKTVKEIQEMIGKSLLDIPTQNIDEPTFILTTNGAYIFTGEGFEKLSESNYPTKSGITLTNTTDEDIDLTNMGIKLEVTDGNITGMKVVDADKLYAPKRRKDLKFQTVSPEWQESVEERLDKIEDDVTFNLPPLTTKGPDGKVTFTDGDKLDPKIIELNDDVPIGNGMTIKDVAHHKNVVKLEKRVAELENKLIALTNRFGNVHFGNDGTKFTVVTSTDGDVLVSGGK